MARGVKLDLDLGSEWGNDWGEVQSAAKPEKAELLTPEKHQLVFKKEKRRGKVVTLVGPLHVSSKDSETLVKTLKKKLGRGGTCKAEWMEFQGDIQSKVRELLEREGYRFKR